MRVKLDDQRRSSETKKSDIIAARRHATYELNWYDYNKSNMKDVDCIEVSAQDTNQIFSESLVQSPTTSPMLQEKIPAPSNITNSKNLERESTCSRVSEQDHPFLGGITITTVQVVEVENQNSRKKNISNISSSLPRKIDNNISKSNVIQVYEVQNNISKSFTNVIQGSEDQHVKFPKPLEPQVVLKQKDRSRSRKPTHIVKTKRQSRLYDANASAQAYSKTVVLSSKRSSLGHFNSTYMQKLPSKESVSNNPSSKKMIRKKRVLVNSTTCNPSFSNDPTDMESDMPISNNQGNRWLPTRHSVPKLLHASLIPLSQHVKNGSVVHVSPRLKQLTRKNSIRRRSSVIVPPVKRRVSQIFRQQLLEQSILMSFNDLQPITKTRHVPRGKQIRKAKKGVSAKLDHELRRERQKRKNLGKHSGQLTKRSHDSILSCKNRQKVQSEQSESKAVNVLSIPRILDTDELVKKVDEELRKKEILMSPRPPPRRIVHGLPTPDSIPSTPQTKSNTSSLLASLPDRRSVKSDEIIPIEPPPFPTHLTHKAMPFPAFQSQNGSMRTLPTIDTFQSQNGSMRTPSTTDTRQSQNGSIRTPTTDTRQSQNGSMRTPSTFDTRQSQNGSMRTPTFDTRQSQNGSMRTPSTIDTRQSQNGSMRTPSTIDVFTN
ncbi:3610_t:CDS:1 [Racocetra fulgida]|uniref:3610_t:CDS:1 n=1 Tax=Racocetra fulgida TaxID=60492 RepID=A0A9N8VRQ8_9GLOM|nr:3610_t:CDS:1 [Racocetra fulgida]